MHWLYLLLAFGTLLLAIAANGAGMLAFWLLATLGLFFVAARSWYIARVGVNERDMSTMIDPAELRRMREIAEARRQQTTPGATGAAAAAPAAPVAVPAVVAVAPEPDRTGA